MERPRPPLLLLQLGGCFVLLCCAGLARSLTITSPDQLMFEKAQGEKVTLPCTFELSEEDEGPLDIEWVLIPADNQKKEKVIVLYAIDKIYNYYEADRMQFTNPDPKSGDGSLDIQNLKTADTGTYQCKVKKAPGVQSIKIQLTVLGLARSLTITSPDQLMFEKAQGEKVTLPCTFELSEEDEGPLDIEWVLIPADNQKKEQTIIMYAVGRIYNDYYAALAGRLQFTNPDPKSGDGSLDIQNLKAADTGTYQCKVKKAPGVQSKKIQLTVLVKPARTKCSIGGSQEIGKDVTLKCVSQEGSPLLSYDWRRVSGTQDLPATSMLNKNTGELLLKNASQEYSGVYSCVASNRVGTDECSIELHVTPPVNTAGIIVGAIIGTLLGLSVLTFLICCWCKKHREKKYEKEVHHDIREDVPPPKSRSSTARSYIGSNRSSLGSMSPSNMEGYTKTPYSQVPSEDFERTPGQNPTFAPSKVAAPNLSRMGAVPVMIPAQSKDGSIV